jgi:hypothetical protein
VEDGELWRLEPMKWAHRKGGKVAAHSVVNEGAWRKSSGGKGQGDRLAAFDR